MNKVFKISLISALAGFLFGFDTVVISGADQQLQSLWGTSDLFHGTFIMSMALWGTVLGAIFASYPCNYFGRKNTLIGIGVLDFLLSFTGTNITFFLGFLSSFTPILFGVAGGALIGAKEEIKSFRMDRFSESNVAKGIYAGTVVLGLVLVGTLGVMSNHSNAEIVGEWYGVYDTIEFQSNGKTTHTSSTDASIEEWRIDDNDLLLVWSEEPEYEYYYKYQITGSHLFVAGYNDDFETIANDGCWVMSSDKDGKNENYWNNVNLSLPEWCNY